MAQYRETISTRLANSGWTYNAKTNIYEMNTWGIEIDIFYNYITPFIEINTDNMACKYKPLILENINWQSHLAKQVEIRQKDQDLYNILQTICACLPVDRLGLNGDVISAIIVSFDGGYLKFVPSAEQIKSKGGNFLETSQILLLVRKNTNAVDGIVAV